MSTVMDVQERRKYIQQFTVNSVAENGCKRILIQLFGLMGHGKSSLINSCIYTLGDKEYEMKVEASGSDGSHTTERITYQLTECITMVDNRGFQYMADNEFGQVYAQLGNFFPLNQKVEWKKDFVELMSKVEDSDATPNYSDFIVPIFVHSAKSVMSDTEISSVKTFFSGCKNMTGVYPIVVLTHRLSKTDSNLEGKFRRTGAEQILEVENYTGRDNIKTRGRCSDLLAVIENALRDVKFRIEQNWNPVTERIKRKKFLLKFMHDFAIAEKEKEAVKKVQEARRNEYNRLKEKASNMWFARFPEF
ncbi:uncharacterized protein [Engystomops pustulosus]|uniref:uncharacterized protein n=1 Tax=Engystomops pustulosus TaxID=76066 RepID=UPI003AFAA190